jgi:hexosaminidase
MLKVIPLVQTFGHLEFVLKHESRTSLREIADFPNCLAAIDVNHCDVDVAFQLVASLIDDFVALTPDCPAIHLGGDEVWHLGSK